MFDRIPTTGRDEAGEFIAWTSDLCSVRRGFGEEVAMLCEEEVNRGRGMLRWLMYTRWQVCDSCFSSLSYQLYLH